MKGKLLKGFYINPKTLEFGVRCIRDTLSDFYNLLDCDTIDIATRKICGFTVDIVCDDNGLLVDNPCPSAFFKPDLVALCGSLFICFGDYSSGELLDLPPIVANAIAERMVEYKLSNGFVGVAVVLDNE